MSDEMLAGKELEDLLHADLTYAEVGFTGSDLPRGYHHLRHRVVVGAGPDRFEEASRTLLEWRMHRRAGVSVRPSNDPVEERTVAVLRLGWGALGVDAPVRVVYTIDEDRRRGFAYGTLPGHPECGEEAFVLELRDDDKVEFSITAFSRPATRLARLGGPVGRGIQRWMTNRYLRAL